jgi:hypothetical protein
MDYGDKKIKAIAKLPTSRRAAKAIRKWKAIDHRETRHREKVETHGLVRDEEAWNDGDDDFSEGASSHRSYGRGNSSMLAKWAEKVTKDLTPESKLSKVRSVMPKTAKAQNMIRSLEWRKPFETEHRKLTSVTRRDSPKKAKPTDPVMPTDAEAIERLRKVIERGGHGEFNRLLKSVQHQDPALYPDQKNVAKYPYLPSVKDIPDFWAWLKKQVTVNKVNKVVTRGYAYGGGRSGLFPDTFFAVMKFIGFPNY